jgi:hypothetical protein
MLTLTLLAVLAAAPAQAQTAPGKAPAAAQKKGPDVALLPFTPDSIRAVVTSHMDQIQDCYEERLAESGKAKRGVIKTAFKITPEGMVKGAHVLRRGTTLHDAELQRCVVTVVSSMEFPKPPENRDYPVEYPFNLKPVR